MHAFTELILLIIIIVIIFGPSTAPRLGEAIGRMLRRRGRGSAADSDED